MTDGEFLRLATLYLEDAIDASERNLLNQELANSPSRVRQFNDLRFMTGLIYEYGQSTQLVGVNDTVTAQSVGPNTLNRSHAETAASPETQSNARRRIAGITLAIFVTAAAILLVFHQRGSQLIRDETGPVIATLAYTSYAEWRNDKYLLGDLIGKGTLELKVGLARLDFRNGATVTLQGPADFEILSADRANLRSGILTASIPETAVGFQVVTPNMDVVDLGTAFGVAVGIDGETDVCVFEGEVKVSRPGNQTPNSTRLLSEGNALRWNPEKNAFTSVDFNSYRYEKAWPVTSGVLQATGSIKFVAPGPSFAPGLYEDDEHVLVFQERTDVLIQEDLSVDFGESGQYQHIPRNKSYQIPAGIRVRSYLLQLDPVGRLAKEIENKPRAMGQVIFDRSVLGLITRSSKLNMTDKLLGHPRADYVKTRRGIEPPRPKDKGDVERDVVILSEDRRTLSVDLSAGTAIDQIRVIVEETR